MPDNNFPPGGIADQLIHNGGFIFPKPSDYVSSNVNPVDYFNNMMDSVTSMPIKPTGINRVTPISPFQIDTSGRFPRQLIGADNEDLYAQGQHWYTKLGNDALKMLSLAGTTFVQGTVGLVNGVYKWIDDGRFASLYDNDLNRSLDQFNQKLENQFPNYYTKQERDAAWYSPSNLLTANFLFDKVLKNLGFSLGAAAGGFAWGAALKGIGLTGMLARTGEGLLDAAKATDTALEAIPQAERASTFLNTLKETAAKYGGQTLGNVLTKSDRIFTAALGTTGEASMEALNNLNEFRNNLISQYEQQHGYKPTGEDLDNINQMAEGVGNWSFGLNVALLTGTNYIQFPKILNSSYKAEKALVNDIETQPLTQTAEGVVESALPKSGIAKRLYQAKNIAGLLFNPTEGFEEGAQYTIQEGTEDYFNKAYYGKDKSFMTSLSQGIHQTLNTKEGIENILIGGLSGALQTSGIIPYHLVPGVNKVFGGENEIKERGFTGYGGERAEVTQHAIEALNKVKFRDYLKDTAETQNRAAVLQNQREAAIRQGDILESKDLEYDFAHNYLANRIKHGRFDFVQHDIDLYKQAAATQEGFEQLQRDGYAASTDTQASFLQRLDNFQEHANNVKNLYDSLNLKYAGLGTRDDKGEFKRAYPQEVIDKMVYAASKVKDYDHRIPQLSSTLLDKGISVQEILNPFATNPRSNESSEAVKNAVEQINNLDDLEETKTDLKQSLTDILELTQRRKQFLKEYNDIVKNPSSYKERVNEQGERITANNKKKRSILPEDETEQYRDKLPSDNRTLDEIKAQYGEGEQSETDILKKVAVSPYTTTAERELAKKLLEKSDEKATINLNDTSLPIAGQHIAGNTSINYEATARDYEKGNVPVEAAILSQIAKKYPDLAEDVTKSQSVSKEDLQKEQEAIDKAAEEISKMTSKEKQTLSSTAGNTSTPSPEENAEHPDDPKKRIERVFNADIHNPNKENEFNKRHQNFLQVADTLPYRDNLQQLIVTANNEDSLGLTGLTAAFTKGSQYEGKEKDPSEGPIVKVMVLQEKGKHYFINEKGEKISKIGKSKKGLESAKSKINKVLKKLGLSEVLGSHDFIVAKEIAPGKLDKLDNHSEAIFDHTNGNIIVRAKAKISTIIHELIHGRIASRNLSVEERNAIKQRARKLSKQIIDFSSELEGENFPHYFVGTIKNYSGKETAEEFATHYLTEKEYRDQLSRFPEEIQKRFLAIVSEITGLTQEEVEAFINTDLSGEIKLEAESLNESVDINSVVASVAPKATLNWSKEYGEQQNFSHATEEEAELWRKQWEEKRKEIFNWTGENYFPFNISRGTGAVREQDTETKQSKRNSVVGSLLPEGSENLLNTVQNLVQVSTGTTHQFNGENINVQPGRPFFAYKSSFDFLNNRYLNQQEAETVFAILKQITQEIKDGKGLNTKLRDFLNGIIYFAKPTNQDGEAKPLLQNNIFFEGPTWFFGKKSDTEAALQIPFTVDALEANKDQIVSTIQGMFNNVNNHKLTQLKGQAYDEYFLDKDGNLQTRTWPNYQSYLIAAKNPDGTERDIPLTTNLAPQAKSPEGRNYKYKYTWNPDLLQEPDMSSLQKKPEVKEEPVQKKEAFTESEQAQKNEQPKEIAYTSKREPISYSIQGDDLVIEKNESYQSALKRLMDAGNSQEDSENAIQQTVINHIVAQQDNTKETLQPKQEDVKNNLQPSDISKLSNKEVHDNIRQPDVKVLGNLVNKREATSPGGKIIEEKYENGVIQRIIANDESRYERLVQNNGNQVGRPIIDAAINSKEFAKFFDGKSALSLTKQEVDTLFRDKFREANNQIGGPDDEVFSTVRNWEYIKGNMDKERDWIQKRFNLPVHVVENIIKKTDGGYAFGKLRDQAITLWEGAQQGTGYHEAFEAVWNLFTEEKERQAHLRDFRRRQGTFTDDNGNTVEYKNATDSQAKEEMAEEFRHYVLNKQPKKQGLVARFIQWLYNTIHDLFIQPKNSLEELFRKIDSGYYKSSSPLNGNLDSKSEKIKSLIKEYYQLITSEDLVEFPNNMKTKDPVTGKYFTGTELMEQIREVEGKKDISSWMGREFSERRGYSKNQIEKFFGARGRNSIVQELIGLVGETNASSYTSLLRNPEFGLEEVLFQIDQEYGNKEQYSTIPGLDAASTQKVVQGIATKIILQFTKAVKEGTKSFTQFDLGEDLPTQEYFDAAFASIRQDLTSEKAAGKYNGVLAAIEAARADLEKKVNEYLKTLKINVQEADADLEDDEASFSRDEAYLKDYYKWDGGRNAAASIRLLISTIPEVEIDPEKGTLRPKRDDSTFMISMINSAPLWNQLYQELHKLNTPPEKEQRLLELAKTNLPIQMLVQRLGLEKEAPTDDDFELRAKFFHTFSKQRPIALVQVKEDGNVFIKEMNQGDAIRRLTTDWLDREKWQQDSGLVEWKPNENGEGGVWALNQEKIESIIPGEIRNLSSQLKVLSILGIPSAKELWENLKGKDKEKFNNYIASIYSILKSKEVKNAATPASLKLETPIRGLAQLYVKTSGEYPESTFVGLTGERRTEFIQGNALSTWINDINNAQSLNELKQILPHLNQLWAKNSQYLSDNNFTTAREAKTPLFEVEYVQGTDNRDEDDKVETEKLTEANRLLQEINLNLGGHFYTVLPADAKTEYTIKTNPLFGIQDVQSNEFLNKLQDIFNSYYEVEKKLYQEDGKERLLKPIVGDYAAKIISKEKLQDWLKDLVQQQKQFLQDQKIVKEFDKNGQTFFSFEGLNTDFTNKNNLNSDALSREDLNNILTLRTVNYAINNIEMTKLFFGDPVAYGSTESMLKRIKSFLSPREISVYNWDDFNSWANEHYNKGLQPDDFGYYTHKDYADTITLGTINSYAATIADDEYLPEEISIPYKKSDSTDGQGHATIPGYREIRIKRGHTWTPHDQALYEYLMARDRQLMYEDGKLTDDTYRKELQEKDKRILENGPDTEGQLYVLKPVGSGYTLTDDPFLDKYSLFPLTYAAVRKTALGDHYIEMVKKGIAYGVFDSGRKVGQGPIQEFYDEKGNAKTNYSNTVQIPYRYLGIQTETAGSKDSQTTGSQVSKYITTNIYDGGVPTDYKGDLLSWIKLSEEERKKASPRHALAEHNREVREQMVEEEYQTLLRKLGIEQEGHTFEVDKEVVQKLLQNELLRRELPNNIKDALQVENGEWKVPLEALNNYREIKNIIYSFVQKHISKQKVNGAPAVQVSSGGMSDIGIKKATINGKQAWVSSNLKFYGAEYRDGKITKVNRMQVYMSVPSQLIKMFPGKTAEEIFDILKSSPEGQDILSNIGFRIPTQEMNSVDAFEIAGFLPIGYVNTIVVPEALTTKAGSDFDVDKLNTYLKNIFRTKKNEVMPIPFFGYGKDAKDKIKNWINEQVAKDFLDLSEVWEDPDAIENLEFNTEKEIEKLNSGKKLEDRVNTIYKKSLENEYFRSMEALILHPDNYERLIRPNNADKSKEIADNLQKLAPKEFGSSVSSILNPKDMSHMRHLFLLAKQWVGMVAVHATGHTLTQKFPIILNPARLERITKDEKDTIENLNIALPHKTITLEDGKSYATLSNGRSYTGTDKEGEYISDVISRRLDGTVDAVKDPWLSVIIQNTNMVGIHMLLDRLSVPEEISAYFLNQPIIRRFNQLMDQRGEDEYESDVIKQLKTEFSVDNKNGGKTIVTKFPTQDVSKLSRHLQDNISRYYTEPESISHQDNAEQRFIFDEFLKYRVLARHLQKFNQATSYDTASFTDMNTAEFKEAQTRDAENNNLFTSVEDILNKTFIGKIRDKMLEANQAISSSLFRFDSPQVRRFIMPVLNQIRQYTFGADNYLSAARKVEQSFIQYLIQNSGLNLRLKELLVDPNTNIATKFNNLKLKGDIAENPVIKALKISGSASDTATKNVQLFSKAYDVFTSNIYTAALLELKYNAYTASFYRDLVDAAFLQAGISQQNNSFSDIIPNEDFREKLEQAINQLNNPDLMNAFSSTGAFYRNRWWDTDSVPRAVYKGKNVLTKQVWKPAEVPFLYKVNSKSRVANAPFITISSIKPEFQDERDGANRVVKSLKNTRKQMAKKGDFSYKQTVLLQRVPGISTPGFMGTEDYYYAPVHAYGDAQRAQEYYSTTEKPSVLKNNVYDTGKEYPVEKIAESFHKWKGNTKQNEVNSLTSQEAIEKLKEQGIIKKDCKG